MFRDHSFVDIIMKVWDCQWSIYLLLLVDVYAADVWLYETALVFLKLWYTQLILLNIDNIYPKYASTHQGCSLVLLCKKTPLLFFHWYYRIAGKRAATAYQHLPWNRK